MKATTRAKKIPAAYHHGDLRNALLAVARAQLAAGAYESLSLRELARLAGVSPNAPYRHFASKDEILAEIAAQGFNELSARFDAERTSDPGERLARMSDIYTAFALEHAALYRVMFGAEKPALMAFDVVDQAGRACFGRLVDATVRAVGHGGPDDPESLTRALAIWSFVHGWSRLAIDGIAQSLVGDLMPRASDVARSIIASWKAR
jgi:AcrR family transcriptional regulator